MFKNEINSLQQTAINIALMDNQIRLIKNKTTPSVIDYYLNSNTPVQINSIKNSTLNNFNIGGTLKISMNTNVTIYIEYTDSKTLTVTNQYIFNDVQFNSGDYSIPINTITSINNVSVYALSSSPLYISNYIEVL